MKNFVSDFSLFPIKHLNKPNWEYRKATWPRDIEVDVHRLYEKITAEPIIYERVKFYNNENQKCTIRWNEEDQFLVENDENYNFLIRRDSTFHREIEISETDEKNIPHEMLCVICLTHKRTHAIPECGHVSMCEPCSHKVFSADQKCPICRKSMSYPPIKLFFS
jgi:hypothetical protein